MNRVIMAALAAFFASPALADEGVEVRSRTELPDNWTLRSYQASVSHQFSFCSVSTSYDTAARAAARAKSLHLSLVMYPTGKTAITLTGDGWRMTEGKKHMLYMRFSSGNWYKVEAEAFENGLIAYGMNAEWLKEFMKAQGWSVSIDDTNIGGYSLSSSLDAAVAVAKCVTASAEPSHGTTETFGAANAPQSPSGDAETFGGSEPTPEQAKDTF